MAKKSAKKSRQVPAKVRPKTKASALAPARGNGPRKLKNPKNLPSIARLTKASWSTIWRYRQLFLGLTIVYGLLNLILVQGLSNSTDVNSIKSQVTSAFHGHVNQLVSSLSIFAVLLSSAGNGSSQTAGGYQIFLALITSLAVIWALRQVMADHSATVRQSYYRGMYPLIPFILVLLVLVLELIPLIIGASVLSIVISNGIAIGAIEKIIWGLVFLGLALISLYLLSSSIFALYIVTLPDMTPIKALKSAKQLVKGRRYLVIRKVLALPVILLIAAAIIMLPIIILLTAVSSWIFFLLTMFALVAVHAYMYTFYRELLND